MQQGGGEDAAEVTVSEDDGSCERWEVSAIYESSYVCVGFILGEHVRKTDDGRGIYHVDARVLSTGGYELKS